MWDQSFQSTGLTRLTNNLRHYWLKGHCHSDFPVCWSKLLKNLITNLFSDIKLLLGHQEKNMKWFLWTRINYNRFSAIFSEIHRRNNPFPSWLSTAKDEWTSFCALVGLLLTKLNHYFDIYIHTNIFLVLKIGYTAPLSISGEFIKWYCTLLEDCMCPHGNHVGG